MTISRSEAVPVISIAAAVIQDETKRVLLVRKRGTDRFMLPGGKLDPDESPIDALRRELLEELGCALASEPRQLGTFEAPAANEPGYRVRAEIFIAHLAGEPIVGSEIDDLVWHDPETPPNFAIAPLAQDEVLPALVAGREVPL